MTILRSLSPWIVFAVLSAFLPDRWAAVAACVAAIAILVIGWRTVRRMSALVIEASTTVFFVIVAVLANAAPQWDIGRWTGAASELWLALTVAVTLLIQHPFTLGIARSHAPEEIWDRPEFFAFNVKLTRAWLIAFCTGGAILTVLAVSDRTSAWFTVPVIVLAILIPARYTTHLIATFKEGFAR